MKRTVRYRVAIYAEVAGATDIDIENPSDDDEVLDALNQLGEMNVIANLFPLNENGNLEISPDHITLLMIEPDSNA